VAAEARLLVGRVSNIVLVEYRGHLGGQMISDAHVGVVMNFSEFE